MNSEKNIKFIEEKVRTLSNNALLHLLCDFEIGVLDQDGYSETMTLTREQLIQLALRETFSYYSVSCQNCYYDEEIAAKLMLNRWSQYWMFC